MNTQPKPVAESSKLAQLREMSVVVADTGDYAAVQRLRPIDCTTNPTIVRKALDLPVYADLIEEQLGWGRTQSGAADAVAAAVADRLTIGVGKKLLELIPGRVSTEVDADLSHDTEATIAKAREFIAMYAEQGVPRERVLIKVAATWEGVRAAERLQREGIDCNLTLIFNHTQALACAEAGVFLVSPFVGRILDWHVARGELPSSIDEDPGVVFVRKVYGAFKRRGAATVVMGASFRSTAQIEALAGCDRLTISPDLLDRLEQDTGTVLRRLSPMAAVPSADQPIDADRFQRDLAQDEMATDKLRDGIAIFAKDLAALRDDIAAKLR
ncbi:transaldolase [Luteimonas sp. SX5]|uniref:Transaldolase n=1 Tax=Luteimonas galliterrae TaxID=2940486 RepID=A0ABT0MJQ6_9GAMM|nr:transaldolase [Luteimonas galliterrae]MCL1635096.1 transaldolase [Luteimonas galliterrae]